MTCAICGIRKARRACPGVHGEICTICCATGREETINCPLTCGYLQDAHQHERVPEVDPRTLPNTDIRVTDEFLAEQEMLLAFTGSALFEAAMKTEGTTDLDVRSALAALVTTYRSLESGIYYESRPENPFAAAIAEHVQERITTVREKEKEARGVSVIRDSAVLGVLAFLQRLEFMQNNGREKSKAFLDFLGRFALAPPPQSELSLQPDEPRIIL